VSSPSPICEGAAGVLFDKDFYLAHCGAAVGEDALAHFLREGWRAGADPAPWFSTAAYLADHPDVAEAGANPFVHFAVHGLAEGRGARSTAIGGDAVAFVTETDLVAAEFDSDFYLAENPDVAEAGLDPLSHFLATGWREGRDPNRDFSVTDYLEIHADVRAAGLNPFTHYLLAGRRQGRATALRLGFRHKVATRATPLAERIARALQTPVAISAPEELHGALQGLAPGPLHVTVSHDDYRRSCAGIQICIQREAAAMRQLGFRPLHLFPAAPFPVVRAPGESLPLGVLIDGEPAGVHPADVIADTLETVCGGRAAAFALHSLVGHAPDEILAILAALDVRDATYWVHDFSSLCAGFHLMRNDVADCGAPPLESAACGICLYAARRAFQVEAHRCLFEQIPFRVAAPSAGALSAWRRGGQPSATEIVHPHARLGAASPRPRPFASPIRTAFVGAQATHKGWPVYLALADTFHDDPRYFFHQFGAVRSPRLRGPHVAVRVDLDHPAAMAEALAAHGIDVVVLWSICQETFCLAAMEALASGAVIVTNADSGNVASLVRRTGRGVILEDEATLRAWFGGAEAEACVRSLACGPAPLEFSRLTADLVNTARFEQP
jgi:hypothetical protein